MNTQGSRVVRRTTIVLVALGLTLGLALGATAPAPASTGNEPAGGRLEVVATELPLPVPDLPDTELEVDIEDINNRGQVVGTLGPWSYKQTLLWERGQIRDLGASEPAERPNINDRGQVATALGGRAVVWRRGEITDLGDASTSAIWDINERGEVLVVQGAGTDDWSLTLWRNGTFTDVITASEVPGTRLGQLSLSNAGHVAGSVMSPECGGLCERPFVWHDGTRTDLDYNGSVVGVTSSGQTFGYELAGFDDWHRVTTRDGETVRLPMLGGFDGGPVDINERGQMVGHITDSDGADAVLWDGGEAIELTSSLPPGNRALAINERGQVLIDNSQEGLYLWDDGELVHLPGSGSNTTAALNDRGQVAAGDEHPMLWTVRRRR
jgi:uncharacterized membrane protein